MYKIVLEKTVTKFLEKHKGQEIISRFEKSLHILALDPFENNLDIKVLKGLPNSYRLRIGDYRFLYEINEEVLVISFFQAGSRGDIYKK